MSFGPALSGSPHALLEWLGLAMLALAVGLLWAGLLWAQDDDSEDGP